MRETQDLAIILKTIRYEERHQISTAITANHGKISALAKNSIHSKRFGGALEPFVASIWHFSIKPHAELHFLSQAEIRYSYENLRKDFTSFALASVFNEILLRAALPQQPCSDLFRLHSNALASLEEIRKSTKGLHLLNAYIAKILQWNGNQPQMKNCLACKKNLSWDFHDKDLFTLITNNAGWICTKCKKTGLYHIHEGKTQSLPVYDIEITKKELSYIEFTLRTPIRQIDESTHAVGDQTKIFRCLNTLLAYHLPGFDSHPLKSLRFIDLQSP